MAAGPGTALLVVAATHSPATKVLDLTEKRYADLDVILPFAMTVSASAIFGCNTYVSAVWDASVPSNRRR